jgi:hypothetical protein
MLTAPIGNGSLTIRNSFPTLKVGGFPDPLTHH